jgi:hypothetical protein
LLRRAADAAEPGDWRAENVRIRHEPVGDDFNLTLVWSDVS